MTQCTFTKPNINLVEIAPVPVRHITDVGRVDVIEDRVVLTYYELQPGDPGHPEAVIVDKVSFAISQIPDAVQFVMSALAQAARQSVESKHLVLQ